MQCILTRAIFAQVSVFYTEMQCFYYKSQFHFGHQSFQTKVYTDLAKFTLQMSLQTYQFCTCVLQTFQKLFYLHCYFHSYFQILINVATLLCLILSCSTMRVVSLRSRCSNSNNHVNKRLENKYFRGVVSCQIIWQPLEKKLCRD